TAPRKEGGRPPPPHPALDDIAGNALLEDAGQKDLEVVEPLLPDHRVRKLDDLITEEIAVPAGGEVLAKIVPAPRADVAQDDGVGRDPAGDAGAQVVDAELVLDPDLVHQRLL